MSAPVPRPGPRVRPPRGGRPSWRTRRRLRAGATLVVAAALAGLQGWSTPAPTGARRTVATARADLDPGTVLDDDTVEIRAVDADAAPSAADPDAVIGRTLHDRVVAGEVITTARVGSAGAVGLAARVPSDRRAIALGRDTIAPALQTGQVVDLYVAGAGSSMPRGDPPGDDPSGAGAAVRAATAGAMVVEVTDEVVTVSVAQQDAAAVARAVGTERIVVVLRGGS